MQQAIRSALAVVLAASMPAMAQKFPSRPVTLVSEFSAGAGGDVVLRVIANRMAEVTGQPLVIENRPGANGVLAGQQVAHAAADGYTLLASTPNMQVIGVALGGTPNYQPRKELTPVATIGGSATLLLVRLGGPSSLAELLAFAKNNPGKLAVGHSGVASTFHLMGEEIKLLTGVSWTDVPYKGGLPATQAVAAGQIDASLAIVGSALPLVRSGKLNAVAVFGASSRIKAFPDIPLVTETLPGFKGVPSWTGIFAPAGLPQPIRTQLNAAFVKVLNVPEIRAKLEDTGFQVMTLSAEEFDSRIASDIELVGRILKAAKITAPSR